MNNYSNILLISDLDGTLLNDDQKISEENKEAIRDFKSKGGLVSIATGRVKDSANKFVEELKVDVPVIFSNGAVIYDPVKDSNIWDKSLSNYRLLLENIMEMSKGEDILIHIYQDDHSYYYGPKDMLDQSDYKEGVVSTPISKADLDQPTSKIMMICDNTKLLEEIENYVKESNFPGNTVYSHHNYFEVLPKNVDKGIALDHLIKIIEERNNVEIKTVALGDNNNDLKMLQGADYGFYVENSHESLKLRELLPTVSNMDNAVKVVIEDFIYKRL